MAEQESITEFPVNSESASNMEGHWYILHTYSGFEQRVEQMIRELMRSGQDQGCIHDVVVPTEKVIIPYLYITYSYCYTMISYFVYF